MRKLYLKWRGEVAVMVIVIVIEIVIVIVMAMMMVIVMVVEMVFTKFQSQASTEPATAYPPLEPVQSAQLQANSSLFLREACFPVLYTANRRLATLRGGAVQMAEDIVPE